MTLPNQFQHQNSYTASPVATNKKPPKEQSATAPKYRGVRRRPRGRFAAEIRDQHSKKRKWLGTFETAEEAAYAYNYAARAMHGLKARTNFVYPNATCIVDPHGFANSHPYINWSLFQNPPPSSSPIDTFMINNINSSPPTCTVSPYWNVANYNNHPPLPSVASLYNDVLLLRDLVSSSLASSLHGPPLTASSSLFSGSEAMVKPSSSVSGPTLSIPHMAPLLGATNNTTIPLFSAHDGATKPSGFANSGVNLFPSHSSQTSSSPSNHSFSSSTTTSCTAGQAVSHQSYYYPHLSGQSLDECNVVSKKKEINNEAADFSENNPNGSATSSQEFLVHDNQLLMMNVEGEEDQNSIYNDLIFQFPLPDLMNDFVSL